ncbi:MAG: hypothetical protein K0Q55_2536 [Verrucomicrobia bacterium]|nr:hypothetical protein [Verrucomicrobiota bacterium]
MLADIGSDEQEENFRRDTVIRSVMHAGRVTAEDDDSAVHHADEGIAGVGQGDTFSDAGGVQVLAFLQGAQERLLGGRLSGDLRDMIDQFRQDGIAARAPKLELDRGRSQ